MANAYKVLAQTNPSAAVLTDSYTVPAATKTILSGVQVCNRSATATTIRISVAKAGVADDNKQYFYYDYPVAGNDGYTVMQGVTLDTTDVVRVYATLATVSFNICGTEIT